MIRFKLSFSRKAHRPCRMDGCRLAWAPLGPSRSRLRRRRLRAQGETAEQKARREQDLKVLEEAIAANAEARRRLEAEVDDPSRRTGPSSTRP